MIFESVAKNSSSADSKIGSKTMLMLIYKSAVDYAAIN